MRTLLTLCLLACVAARAEVQLQVEFERHTQFVAGESCEIAVRIVNYTGDVLKLGGKPDWVQISLDEVNGGSVTRLRDIPDVGEFSLKPSTRGTLRIDLAPCFRIDHPGRYQVSATMIDPTSGVTVASRPVEFEVIHGTTLWEQAFSIPSTGGRAPTHRKFSLQQANFLTKPELYARVSDESDSAIFSVRLLGPLVSFSSPDHMIDRRTRLHVLHRVGSEQFLYHVIAPDGTLEARRMYVFSERAPELRVNDQGEVAVIGGARRVSESIDYSLSEEKAEAPAHAVNDKDSKSSKL
jgi:hypothetical protein